VFWFTCKHCLNAVHLDGSGFCAPRRTTFVPFCIIPLLYCLTSFLQLPAVDICKFFTLPVLLELMPRLQFRTLPYHSSLFDRYSAFCCLPALPRCPVCASLFCTLDYSPFITPSLLSPTCLCAGFLRLGRCCCAVHCWMRHGFMLDACGQPVAGRSLLLPLLLRTGRRCLPIYVTFTCCLHTFICDIRCCSMPSTPPVLFFVVCFPLVMLYRLEPSYCGSYLFSFHRWSVSRWRMVLLRTAVWSECSVVYIVPCAGSVLRDSENKHNSVGKMSRIWVVDAAYLTCAHIASVSAPATAKMDVAE